MPARKRPIQPSKGKPQAAEVGGKKKKKEQQGIKRNENLLCHLPHFSQFSRAL